MEMSVKQRKTSITQKKAKKYLRKKLTTTDPHIPHRMSVRRMVDQMNWIKFSNNDVKLAGVDGISR